MRDINIFETNLFPYLEGEELQDRTLTLTIRDIKPEKLRNSAGKEEAKEVLFFAETSKGFVLNKTNAKRIAVLYGKQTGAWTGQRITLYTEPVQAFGETHNALRVAPAIPDGSKPDPEIAKADQVDHWWYERNPTKGQFFGGAKDAGFTPAQAAKILKAAGFSNGYDPTLAPQMWETLMKSQSTQANVPMTQAQAVEAAINSWPATIDGFVKSIRALKQFHFWSDEEIMNQAKDFLKSVSLEYSPEIAHKMQLDLMVEANNRSAMDEVEADAVQPPVAGDLTSDELAETIAGDHTNVQVEAELAQPDEI